jgi:VIT1/CCC1 family predicted Fe2+/Mn2+ transporter
MAVQAPIDTETESRWRQALVAETDAAAVYGALAEVEADASRRALLEALAADEKRHAAYWARRLRDAGVDPGEPEPGQRARILGRLAGQFGDTVVLPIMRDRERASTEAYSADGDVPELTADEQKHARLIESLVGTERGEPIGRALARLQRGRGDGGNALRAAVLGVNDGLVSNLSLVMGVAGAGVASRDILLTGIAGLIAGACSMAMGEWISVQSSRELHENELRQERVRIEEEPHAEQAELALVYEQKGMPPQQAKEVAASLMADSQTALDTHAREELGIDPHELGGSPWVAAGASFALFVVGAIVPVLAFVFLEGFAAVAVALGAAVVALFAIGASITLLTGTGVWRSGFRQLTFGLGAAAVTYGVGTLFGVAVG